MAMANVWADVRLRSFETHASPPLRLLTRALTGTNRPLRFGFIACLMATACLRRPVTSGLALRPSTFTLTAWQGHSVNVNSHGSN